MNEIKILPAEEPANAPPQGQTNPPRRILVVDDEPLIRQLNSEVLTDSGYQVDTAEDGAVAWNMLLLNKYDLVMTDQEMPNVSGIDLLKKLHAARMALPVIMATGTWPAGEFTRQPWLQPTSALLKPYTTEEFLGAVEKVLGAPDAVVSSSQLFRDCAMQDKRIPQTSESASAPIRDQTNLHQRILVVDDDQDSRQISVDVLIGSGYDVACARDGAAGWEALQSDNYDLVITDNKMPRMTGVEMIEKLRSAAMAIPVIMATRNLPVHVFARRPWLKPDATLERPFSNEELLLTVNKILGTDDGSDDQKESLLPKYL
jgi:two-component system chemotaxis response regulator CheY